MNKTLTEPRPKRQKNAILTAVCSMFIATLLPDVRYKQLEVTNYMYDGRGAKRERKSYQRIMYGFIEKRFLSEKEGGKWKK